MRHKKRNKRLGRNKAQRKALVVGLVNNLFRDRQIITTLVKAKETQRLAEKIVTLAKKGGLANQRRAARIIQDKALLSWIFKELGSIYSSYAGGYTRIIHLSPRKGDGASQAILELVNLPKGVLSPDKDTLQKVSKETPDKSSDDHSSKKAKSTGLIEGLRNFLTRRRRQSF